MLGRERVADRRQVRALRLRDLAARPRRWSWRRRASASGSFLREPRRGTARARAGYETTVVTSASAVPGCAHRFSDTGRSTSRWISSSVSNAERVERDRDRALDRVLDRHDADRRPRRARPRRSPRERRVTASARPRRGRPGVQQRLLGERAGGPEERDAEHDRDRSEAAAPGSRAPTVGSSVPTTNETVVVALPPMFSVAAVRAPSTW